MSGHTKLAQECDASVGWFKNGMAARRLEAVVAATTTSRLSHSRLKETDGYSNKPLLCSVRPRSAVQLHDCVIGVRVAAPEFLKATQARGIFVQIYVALLAKARELRWCVWVGGKGWGGVGGGGGIAFECKPSVRRLVTRGPTFFFIARLLDLRFGS